MRKNKILFSLILMSCLWGLVFLPGVWAGAEFTITDIFLSKTNCAQDAAPTPSPCSGKIDSFNTGKTVWHCVTVKNNGDSGSTTAKFYVDGESIGQDGISLVPNFYMTKCKTDTYSSSGSHKFEGKISPCSGICSKEVNFKIGESCEKKIWYKDNDGDGYGNPDNTKEECEKPSGYAGNNGDCNDYNSKVHPGAGEIQCNGIDENCNGEDYCPKPVCQDECSYSGKKECFGNGWKKCGDYDANDCLEWGNYYSCGSDEYCEKGVCKPELLCQDWDGDGYYSYDFLLCPNGDDCNDYAGWIHPGATEICGNEVDEDCNGIPDNSCICDPGETEPCGGTEIGECKLGIKTCMDGHQWGGCKGMVGPTDEVCGDDKDNDCDGKIDEICEPECIDKDGDGYYANCGPFDCDDNYFGQEKFIGCGLNGKGQQPQICSDGVWVNSGSCIDSDVCVNEEVESKPCGTDIGECKKGIKHKECVGGQWSDWGVCGGEVKPTDEVCDGKDNNCNMEADEFTNLCGEYESCIKGKCGGDGLSSYIDCMKDKSGGELFIEGIEVVSEKAKAPCYGINEDDYPSSFAEEMVEGVLAIGICNGAIIFGPLAPEAFAGCVIITGFTIATFPEVSAAHGICGKYLDDAFGEAGEETFCQFDTNKNCKYAGGTSNPWEAICYSCDDGPLLAEVGEVKVQPDSGGNLLFDVEIANYAHWYKKAMGLFEEPGEPDLTLIIRDEFVPESCYGLPGELYCGVYAEEEIVFDKDWQGYIEEGATTKLEFEAEIPDDGGGPKNLVAEIKWCGQEFIISEEWKGEFVPDCEVLNVKEFEVGNTPPEIKVESSGDFYEGEKVEIMVLGSDWDPDSLSFSYEILPGSTKEIEFMESSQYYGYGRKYEWQTKEGDDGIYKIKFCVSDSFVENCQEVGFEVIEDSPVLIHPAEGEITKTTTPLFEWKGTQGPVKHYTVKIFEDGENNGVMTSPSLTETQWQIPIELEDNKGLGMDKHYWWQVMATKNFGVELFSEKNKFWVDCWSNEQCGEEESLGFFCEGEDVYEKVKKPVCKEPGTLNSYCDFKEYKKPKEEHCEFGCYTDEGGEAMCKNAPEICDNGIDDDEDGLRDCGDANDCGEGRVCGEEKACIWSSLPEEGDLPKRKGCCGEGQCVNINGVCIDYDVYYYTGEFICGDDDDWDRCDLDNIGKMSDGGKFICKEEGWMETECSNDEDCEEDYSCVNSECVITKKDWCKDSDKGRDYFTKGTVTSDKYIKGKEDFCYPLSREKYLLEGICKEGKYTWIQKNCRELGDYTCQEGKCVPLSKTKTIVRGAGKK